MGVRQVTTLDCILVVNSGSSSLKLSLFAISTAQCLLSGAVDWPGHSGGGILRLEGQSLSGRLSKTDISDHGAALEFALSALLEQSQVDSGSTVAVRAIGHRVVHGGTLLQESLLIDERVQTEIGRLSSLAPLHNPAALAAIVAAKTQLPEASHVAVFDTSYFSRLPPPSFLYPLPYEWYTEWGIRRYGFHGISHSYCAQRTAALLSRPLQDLRLVICHLGHGCSGTAVHGGEPVATTMGFTPTDGMMMGTRSGSLDPGILPFVQQQHSVPANSLQDTLNLRSGLLGISGISSDLRQLESAAHQGDERAKLAIEMFADRVRASIGSLAVAMGGVDALVLTAGIGENSSTMRAAICERLNCLGLHLDSDRNASRSADCDIATAQSPSRILVIKTREDLMIARETARVLKFPFLFE
jgi:acetate kinase